VAVDGCSRWFRDANRMPRRCSDALRARIEVRSYHLFVDGRPQVPGSAAAAAATDEVAAAARAVESCNDSSSPPANLLMVLQYLAFTEQSAKELGRALQAIVDAPPSTATLVHCSAGKVRCSKQGAPTTLPLMRGLTPRSWCPPAGSNWRRVRNCPPPVRSAPHERLRRLCAKPRHTIHVLC